jgi:hypothetical protein
MLVLLAVLATAMADGLLHDRALGRMSRQIALRYFRSAKCLAVVTEGDSCIMDHLQPLNMATFHVQLLRDVMTSERLTSGPHEHASKRPSIYTRVVQAREFAVTFVHMTFPWK